VAMMATVGGREVLEVVLIHIMVHGHALIGDRDGVEVEEQTSHVEDQVRRQ
jgi:hypothetical protein